MNTILFIFFFNIWSRDKQGGITLQSNVSLLFIRFKKRQTEQMNSFISFFFFNFVDHNQSGDGM